MKRFLLLLIFVPMIVFSQNKNHDKLLQASPSVSTNYAEQPFDVQKYLLDLHINEISNLDSNCLVGKCTIYLKWKNDDAGNKFYFRLKSLNIDSVFYNSDKLIPQKELIKYEYPEFKPDSGWTDTLLSIVPNSGIFSLDDSVIVYYHGKPINEGGSFPFGGVTTSNGQLFANGVGFSDVNVSTTSYWMPCYDHPSDKAQFEAYFHVPKGYSAISVGKLLDSNLTGTDENIYHWKTDLECATYLLTFSAAKFSKFNYLAGDIPVDVYIPEFYSQMIDEKPFVKIPKMVEAYEHYFIPYPFEKVGYYVASIGSMEHQTMIALDYRAVNNNDTMSYTVAHELSHQWFGDLVTPLDFRDAWFNESFATFCEALWANYELGDQSYRNKLLTNLTDFGKVYNDSWNQRLYNFDRLTDYGNYPPLIYNKGAVVIGMLRYVVGDSLFFGGVRYFLEKHKYGNFTTDEFKSDMESYSQMDLSDFFDQFVNQNLMPKLEFTVSGVTKWGDIKDQSNNLYYVAIHSQNPQPLKGLPVELAISDAGGKKYVKTIMFSGTDTTVTFDEPIFNAFGFGVNAGFKVVSLLKVMNTKINFGHISDVKDETDDNIDFEQNGDCININSSKYFKAELFDIFGNKLLETDNFNSNISKKLFLGNLSTGTYFVKINSGERAYLYKVNYVK